MERKNPHLNLVIKTQNESEINGNPFYPEQVIEVSGKGLENRKKQNINNDNYNLISLEEIIDQIPENIGIKYTRSSFKTEKNFFQVGQNLKELTEGSKSARSAGRKSEKNKLFINELFNSNTSENSKILLVKNGSVKNFCYEHTIDKNPLYLEASFSQKHPNIKDLKNKLNLKMVTGSCLFGSESLTLKTNYGKKIQICDPEVAKNTNFAENEKITEIEIKENNSIYELISLLSRGLIIAKLKNKYSSKEIIHNTPKSCYKLYLLPFLIKKKVDLEIYKQYCQIIDKKAESDIKLQKEINPNVQIVDPLEEFCQKNIEYLNNNKNKDFSEKDLINNYFSLKTETAKNLKDFISQNIKDKNITLDNMCYLSYVKVYKDSCSLNTDFVIAVENAVEKHIFHQFLKNKNYKKLPIMAIYVQEPVKYVDYNKNQKIEKILKSTYTVNETFFKNKKSIQIHEMIDLIPSANAQKTLKSIYQSILELKYINKNNLNLGKNNINL